MSYLRWSPVITGSCCDSRSRSSTIVVVTNICLRRRRLTTNKPFTVYRGMSLDHADCAGPARQHDEPCEGSSRSDKPHTWRGQRWHRPAPDGGAAPTHSSYSTLNLAVRLLQYSSTCTYVQQSTTAASIAATNNNHHAQHHTIPHVRQLYTSRNHVPHTHACMHAYIRRLVCILSVLPRYTIMRMAFFFWL